MNVANASRRWWGNKSFLLDLLEILEGLEGQIQSFQNIQLNMVLLITNY